MDTPVVFFVFNRPEVTRQVFARIRDARPARLHVVCDGPRPTRPADAEKVAAVRAIVDQGVDWPCQLVRDYAAENLGCRDRVASGLDRVFAEVEEAIILEDDCLPDPSFFGFCSELLARYRHDERIMHIGGTNLAAGRIRTADSYWFTHHAWIWGWATWRRAWQRYDFTMRTWDERRAALAATFASAWERQYWLSTWEPVQRDLAAANTWGFPWMYSVRSAGALAILPTANLVENIGIGVDSTHMREDAARLRTPTAAAGALRHPTRVSAHPGRDELFTRVYAGDRFDLRANLRSRLRLAREALRVRLAGPRSP